MAKPFFRKAYPTSEDLCYRLGSILREVELVKIDPFFILKRKRALSAVRKSRAEGSMCSKSGVKRSSNGGLLARPDSGEHTMVAEPVVRAVQVKLAVAGMAPDAQDETVVTWAIPPGFVQKDDVRLLL